VQVDSRGSEDCKLGSELDHVVLRYENEFTYFRHSRWPAEFVSYQGTASAVPRETCSTTGL